MPQDGARTSGPEADLERRVPADWWRSLFDALYLQTDGDVVENAANTIADVDLLLAATGIGRGFGRVTGVDRSRYLIRRARRLAQEAGHRIDFHEGDARTPPTPAEQFDCVAILGNSFGYFARPSDDLAMLVAARTALVPGGVLVMDLTDGSWVRRSFAPRSWEWIDRGRFACRERTLSADGTRLVCREIVTDADRGVIADRFYAERLYSRGQIRAVLRAAGFVRVTDQGGVRSASARQQDLGMMERRFFVTARKPKGRAAP
jgi:D-alanine-D-alanine ligase